MKSIFNLLFLLLAGQTAFAQLELPDRSPKASTSLRVGLTDVQVEYSSPAVNKRPIWGYLVPFDKVWRAGANMATNVSFSTDVTIGDAKLNRGKYAFFLIPKTGTNVTTWTAVFNSQFDQWGAYQYDQSKDMVRLEVKVDQLVKVQERLTYSIELTDIENGNIVLEWERKRITIPFKVETMSASLANIDKALKSAAEDKKWSIYAEGADFIMANNGDLALAANYIEESVKLKPIVWNTWIKAQIQAKRSDYKGAIATADSLVGLSAASKDEKDYYDEISKDVAAQVKAWKLKK